MHKQANGGTRRCRAAFLMGAWMACAVGGASAATSYVVPWYVNPARTAQVGAAGTAANEPIDLVLSPDGAWLGIAGTAAADAADASNVQVLRTSDFAGSLSDDVLVNAQGVVTNAGIGGASSALGLGAHPLLLPSETQGRAVGIDRAAGALAALPNGGFTYRAWSRRFAPQAGTVTDASGALAAVRAMDWDAAGANAWSCATTGGALTRWSLTDGGAGGSLSLASTADTVDTGLDTVGSLAIYAIGASSATEYAIVGEANGEAATRGEVRLINLATKAVTTLLTDADRLGDGIAAVRMSHADYFRPRLYALTTAGDIVCYYLSKDLVTATWTRTFTNAELATLGGVPSGTVCALEVSADGGTAFVAFRTADAAAEGEVAPRVAVLRHTPTIWRFYAAGEAGNPSAANEACISDGQWALRYTPSGSGIWIGRGSETSGNAYASTNSAEYMDFSFGFVSNVTANTRMSIFGYYAWGLGTNETCRIPRVLIHSTQLNSYSQSKGWDGMEELVVDAPNVRELYSWLGFVSTLQRIVLNFPNVETMSSFAFSPNSGDYSAAETDAAEWSLPKLKVVGFRALGWSVRQGRVDLPSAAVVSNDAFYLSANLTEARFAEKSRTLQFLGEGAFFATANNPGKLEKVVLGGVDGFYFGKDVFLCQPALKEVAFTGGVPAFDTRAAHSFPDAAARTMFFSVPRDHAAWAAALEGHVTPLSDAERTAVWNAHPNRPMPFGVVDTSVFRTHYEQYVCYDDARASCRVTIDHDTFFGDAVEVSADPAAGPDGTYLPGTTLTLTPKPSATGTFRKWYGDVSHADATNAVLSLVVTNDVWLFARFVHPWTLSADRKTVSNGNFTINCTVADASARMLTLGVEKVLGLFADTDEGQGVLDLGGDVRAADDGTAWTFTTFLRQTSLFVREWRGKGDATTFLSPGTLALWNVHQSLHAMQGAIKDAGMRGQKSYRTFILDEPTMTGSWGDWMTCGQTDLTRVILQTPKLSGLTGTGGFWDAPLSETKFDWWDLSGATRIAHGAFASTSGWRDYVNAAGTLRLPSLRNVEYGGDGPYALGYMAKVEGFELGGATRSTTVTNISKYGFGRNASLRTLTIHNAPDMTVGAEPFRWGQTPRTITFTGRALADDGTAFSNLTATVAAAATKPVVIYASARRGWAGVSYLDYNVTAEERAQVPGKRVIGVYRGGAAAPLGKALVVHPFDSDPTILIIR